MNDHIFTIIQVYQQTSIRSEEFYSLDLNDPRQNLEQSSLPPQAVGGTGKHLFSFIPTLPGKEVVAFTYRYANANISPPLPPHECANPQDGIWSAGGDAHGGHCRDGHGCISALFPADDRRFAFAQICCGENLTAVRLESVQVGLAEQNYVLRAFAGKGETDRAAQLLTRPAAKPPASQPETEVRRSTFSGGAAEAHHMHGSNRGCSGFCSRCRHRVNAGVPRWRKALCPACFFVE